MAHLSPSVDRVGIDAPATNTADSFTIKSTVTVVIHRFLFKRPAFLELLHSTQSTKVVFKEM